MNDEEKEILLNDILDNLHKSTLAIPVPDGYKIQEDSMGAIFTAKSDDNSFMQYLEDGQLDDDETFEARLKKVINETEKSIVESGFRNNELKFLKDIDTELFNFKLYLQDNVVGNVLIRQVNAYFIEPESRYFYEICLAAPPIDKSDTNDNITKNILYRLEYVLNNIKYNEERPL